MGPEMEPSARLYPNLSRPMAEVSVGQARGDHFTAAEPRAARVPQGDVDDTTCCVTNVGGNAASHHLHFFNRRLRKGGRTTHLDTVDVVPCGGRPCTTDAHATACARRARTGHCRGDARGGTSGEFVDVFTTHRAARSTAVLVNQRGRSIPRLRLLPSSHPPQVRR